MARFNNGIIFTNDACIGCNKCISFCPASGANIALGVAGNIPGLVQRHIEVNDKKCTHCGLCISTCSHNARGYKDDTDRFFEDLKAGKAISLLVDSSVYFSLGSKIHKILGYLKFCGVQHIYDVSFGSDICAWAHVRYLKGYVNTGEYPKAFIAHTCAAVTGYAESCMPDLLERIIPVQSPMMCTATYASKYLGDTASFAYLNTCVAEYDEVHGDSQNIVSYNVTLSHLLKKIEDMELDYYNAAADLASDGPGSLITFAGAFKDYVSLFFPKSCVITQYNDFSDLLHQIGNMTDDSSHPLFTTVNLCKGGCISGPGNDLNDYEKDFFQSYNEARNKAYTRINSENSYDALYEELCARYENLHYEDFLCDFTDSYVQPYLIPDATIESIFHDMHKDTPEKQHVDCGSCGYASCRDMAIAVANGYSKMTSCIHYMNDDLMASSFRDTLTPLSNTLGYYIHADELLKRTPTTKYVIAYGNINKLGIINELYGNFKGNAVIMRLAEELRSLFPEDRSVVARFGGGIFCMCFEYTKENMDKLESIQYFNFPELMLNAPITVRFGLCLCEGAGNLNNSTNMAAHASTKCMDRYRNSYILFTDDMLKELDTEAEITSEMHRAMSSNEFVLYLQPQYHHATGVMTGAEILCRWVRSDGVIISPGIFIPIFEKNGFIRNLDHYMWKASFALIKRWMDEGRAIIPLSVNISRLSLVDDEFIDVIQKLQDKYQIDKSLLHFEITESAYVDASQETIADRIQKLRDLGFMIAMDDFGSGYSSLNSLKNLPIDILKLDMGFFRDNHNTERSHTIIDYIVKMGRSLGYDLIAEGVEETSQADYLNHTGCDIIQGYLYAKPMPVEEFEKLM